MDQTRTRMKRGGSSNSRGKPGDVRDARTSRSSRTTSKGGKARTRNARSSTWTTSRCAEGACALMPQLLAPGVRIVHTLPEQQRSRTGHFPHSGGTAPNHCPRSTTATTMNDRTRMQENAAHDSHATPHRQRRSATKQKRAWTPASCRARLPRSKREAAGFRASVW